MIKTALVLGKADLPVGKHAGDFHVCMSRVGAPDVTQKDSAPSFTFDVTEPGDYIFTAMRLATDGTTIGNPVSCNWRTAVPTPEQIDVPIAITLTLA